MSMHSSLDTRRNANAVPALPPHVARWLRATVQQQAYRGENIEKAPCRGLGWGRTCGLRQGHGGDGAPGWPLHEAHVGQVQGQGRARWARSGRRPATLVSDQCSTSTGSLLRAMIFLVCEPKTNSPSGPRPWVTMTIMSQPAFSASSRMAWSTA